MYLHSYVYAYLRKDTLTPYYIGKGIRNRAYGPHGNVPVPKDRSRIVFLETHLTNIGACAIERRMIAWYGRKDLGTGILLNRTDGGDGSFGLKWSQESRNSIKKPKSAEHALAIKNSLIGLRKSEEHKAKIAESVRGHNRKHSDETRAKMSKALKGRIISDETRVKMSASRKGKISGPSETMVCPHCGKEGRGNGMFKWHFSRCRVLLNKTKTIANEI